MPDHVALAHVQRGGGHGIERHPVTILPDFREGAAEGGRWPVAASAFFGLSGGQTRATFTWRASAIDFTRSVRAVIVGPPSKMSK
jgi:hypothetical protein